jgi:hypothetical protein
MIDKPTQMSVVGYERRERMYTLIRSMPLQRLLIEQLPAFLAAFLIAEMFYKFKSFTLECIAFLITWFVIDAVIQYAVKLFRKDQLQN